MSFIDALCPDSALFVLASFGVDGPFQQDTFSVPEAIVPIQCHSHNDYWRVKPLHTALEIGCSSVEADVWIDQGDLLVGHTRQGLSKERTLQKTYINPILDILDRHNKGIVASFAPDAPKHGIFPSDPDRPLILLIDIKTGDDATWDLLNEQLEPFRIKGYLTNFNGSDLVERQVTVVLSGDASFKRIETNPERDLFYDAPLELMGDYTFAGADIEIDFGANAATVEDDFDPMKRPINAAVYSPANSYYASTSFLRSIGYPWHSRLSHEQIEKIRSQIRGAHERGLKVRYWDVPTWPIGVRNYLWRVLVREGVDVLSVDDVKAVAQTDWGPKKGGWNRKWWN